MGVPAFVHYAAHFGTVGVDLFFVISGYIMWTTTEHSARSPLAFWLARIVRIVPLYWIFTTTYVAAALVTPESFFVREAERAAHRQIVPVHSGRASKSRARRSRLHAWLDAEFRNVLLPAARRLCLFVPSPRARFGLLAATFLALVAAGLLIEPAGAIGRTYTDPIMLEFLAGVILAILSPVLMGGGTAAGLALLAAAAGWVAVMYGYGFAPERIVSHGIPAVAAVTGALMIEPAARARTSRLWLMLGDASYSIYLAHPFAQRVFLLGVNRTIGLAKHFADPLRGDGIPCRNFRRCDLPLRDRTAVADRWPQINRPPSADPLIRGIRCGDRLAVRHRAPASGGSVQNRIDRGCRDRADQQEGRAEIRRRDGLLPLGRSASSTAQRADRDAGRDRNCCATLTSEVARLMRARLDVGIGDRVGAGELQRAEEAADQQHGDHHDERRRRREHRAGREQGRGDQRR